MDNPEDLVNLLAGTFTDGSRFSTGNTLPLVGYPWGFNHWSPQSADGSRHTGAWWFNGNWPRLTWMRCTHQPSPWIGDWGWFLFGPQVGEITRNPEHFYEPRGAVMKPHIFDATVAPYGIRIELAPTMHGAMLQVTFPKEAENGGKHICFAEAEWTGHGGQGGDSSAAGSSSSKYPWITGRAMQVHQERMIIANFAMHIRAESAAATKIEAFGDLSCFKYPSDATVVTVRIATSFISAAQATLNLEREIPADATFASVAARARAVWNELLRRVDVVDAGPVSEYSSKHLSVFYTSLFRALSFPRRMDEINAQNEIVHYSPYSPSGRVFPGPGVTDNGFWDTFRTVYPMLGLLYPDLLGPIIQGWLNAFKEGGWLPGWASPGYRNCMVGTFADVVVADAIVKEIPGFELETARLAILKDSFENPPQFSGGAVGKEGLGEYEERGFLAINERAAAGGGGEHVSRTLDYGFADFATAKALGKLAADLTAGESSAAAQAPGSGAALGLGTSATELANQARRLSGRAERACRSLFDRGAGLMVPKFGDGRPSPRFKAIEWGNGFTEGNSWHHSFPPYCMSALAELHGGKEKLLERLHKLLAIPSSFMVGSYGQVSVQQLENGTFPS